MYNYQGGNQQYGRPPGFGAPPGMAGPPGMAPPGMSAPGVTPPAGQANNQQPGRPGGFPPNFNPPAGMPNINFNAPVIRLGTTGPNKPAVPLGGDAGRRESNVEPRSARPGLGAGQSMDAQRQALRESMMQLVPPTKDEISRTIFIGGITEGAGGDEGVERILQCAGNLRRWIRAMDSDNKACRFGFAEYEDPESLATAVDVLRDVEVPVKQQHTNGVKKEEDEDVKVEKSKLLVMVDDASLNYLEQYQASRADQDPIQAQLRMDAAKSSLANVLAELASPSAPMPQTHLSNLDYEGDTSMQNGEEKPDEEVVTIPLTVDDELSDIPAEMRETVAKEIAAFRDRSTRRDMERLRREEELEAQERRKNMAQPRPSRLASPPLTAPSGPAGGANGIPIGPRDRSVLNAPSGPKGYQGSQMPQDYQKGVAFVNGSGINGAGAAGLINREDEDSDASDEEIERRRNEKKDAEQEKMYQDQKRRWLNRERSRTAAVEREKARDKDEQARQDAHKEIMAKQLREWNDDVEFSRKVQEYYLDRSEWIRNRVAFRRKEASEDALDRAAEEREKAREMQEREQARGMADDFLNRQAIELDSKTQAPREPQRFKLSLGAAAQKAQAAASNRRTVADVEGLLEDEEEADTSAKRTLIPIKFDSAADALGLTEEERAQAVRQLAADIPSDKEGLWKWPVKWEFVDETVLGEQLKPFVEKKIVEYLGVQEQMLVEVVEDHIRKRGAPDPLVEQLEGALDEEAEVLVKKLWRMSIPLITLLPSILRFSSLLAMTDFKGLLCRREGESIWNPQSRTSRITTLGLNSFASLFFIIGFANYYTNGLSKVIPYDDMGGDGDWTERMFAGSLLLPFFTSLFFIIRSKGSTKPLHLGWNIGIDCFVGLTLMAVWFFSLSLSRFGGFTTIFWRPWDDCYHDDDFFCLSGYKVVYGLFVTGYAFAFLTIAHLWVLVIIASRRLDLINRSKKRERLPSVQDDGFELRKYQG